LKWNDALSLDMLFKALHVKNIHGVNDGRELESIKHLSGKSILEGNISIVY